MVPYLSLRRLRNATRKLAHTNGPHSRKKVISKKGLSSIELLTYLWKRERPKKGQRKTKVNATAAGNAGSLITF